MPVRWFESLLHNPLKACIVAVAVTLRVVFVVIAAAVVVAVIAVAAVVQFRAQKWLRTIILFSVQLYF